MDKKTKVLLATQTVATATLLSIFASSIDTQKAKTFFKDAGSQVAGCFIPLSDPRFGVGSGIKTPVNASQAEINNLRQYAYLFTPKKETEMTQE